jgi:NAD(P)H dehydrogenase (quinone)
VKTLIVFAHPEPKSFNGGLRDAAVAVLSPLGEVRVSDLYKQGFEAECGRHDFTGTKNPDYLDVIREQGHAFKTKGYAPAIQREIDNLLWADLVILQFPIWWFGPPAILKGWMDRVFVPGHTYGRGKWFETGGMAGKRALVSATATASAASYSWRGRYGDLDNLLWPVLLSLRFVGFDVLKPHLSGEAHSSEEHRKALIHAYAKRVAGIGAETPMFFHPESDFAEGDILKPGVKARTVAQRD